MLRTLPLLEGMLIRFAFRQSFVPVMTSWRALPITVDVELPPIATGGELQP